MTGHDLLPAILAPTKAAHRTAERIARLWPGLTPIGPEGFADAAREAFLAGRPVIAVCAAGILIRVLAPLIADKHREPPVVAVSADGSMVVPLLGGHHGANPLARRIASALCSRAAITTAGDLAFGVALDAPPAGWRLAPGDPKPAMARLLGGAPAVIDGALSWIDRAAFSGTDGNAAPVVLRESLVPATTGPDALVYHPSRLAVGIGCERGATADEILSLIRETLEEAGLTLDAVALLASLDLKMDEPGLAAAAATLDRPLRFFNAATLEAETPRLANPSDIVFRAVGCHGVAEGAALAAAGPGGRLLVPKRRSARATCAVALAETVLVPAAIGLARGTLALVGIGPGDPRWRTPEADTMLRQASDLVGYGLYLDLLGPLAAGRQCHAFGLGEETERVRHALDLAASGRRVALVCSGDAGIYAMASLVWEEIETAGRADWARVAVVMTPGVTAVQALAARCGAPLGHDFCLISLSDLLTPWPVIERRLRAAAEGDFVVALYNPVSQRRRRPFERAREILVAHRPPATPVVIGRNLGRPGEAVTVTTLDRVTASDIDMLSVVLIGSSETRVVERPEGRVVYTPRGYAAKRMDKAS